VLVGVEAENRQSVSSQEELSGSAYSVSVIVRIAKEGRIPSTGGRKLAYGRRKRGKEVSQREVKTPEGFRLPEAGPLI